MINKEYIIPVCFMLAIFSFFIYQAGKFSGRAEILLEIRQGYTLVTETNQVVTTKWQKK